MEERRNQGLCYYCNEKYSPGHKCKEPKFFQIDATNQSSLKEAPPFEEPEEEDEENQWDNALPTTPNEPVISLHFLAGISSPQTLKIRGFIKHRPVVVLIDSGSTHNFIHQRVIEAMRCFVRAVSNFQVQIADGGTMKCEGHCENAKIQMGDNQLKTHMFSIHMGGCDIVLGVEWLCTLGPITMDFQELYMSFKQNNHTHTLRRLQAGAPSIISLHRIEKLLKKGHHGEAQPPNVRPYRYPFAQNNEIEKIIKELLEAGIIHPSISPYSLPVVMVLKKDGEWRMCPDFRALKKLTVKDKLPILVVDDFLDELNGAQFFTKLNLHSVYHQIRMKEVDIPNTAF
eukprot:PITA_02246